MSIYLYNIGRAFSLKDLSPFCMKLETYFKLTQIPYQALPGDPRIAPKGKFPYIKHHSHYLADSSLIIEYLKTTYGDILDHDLSEQQRHQAMAFKNMIEEHLYFVELFFRWQQPQGYRVLKPILTKLIKENMKVPWLLACVIRFKIHNQLIKQCFYHGISRHQPKEVASMGIAMVKAIDGFLGEKPFFFGNRPHSIDATVYAFMESMLNCPVPSPVSDYARGLTGIVRYCQRINTIYYQAQDMDSTLHIKPISMPHQTKQTSDSLVH